MPINIATLLEASCDWQEELKRSLDLCRDDDIIVHYQKVAFAFPSANKHPTSFDHTQIDFQRLQEWARVAGWDIENISDANKSGNGYSEFVRFKRV